LEEKIEETQFLRKGKGGEVSLFSIGIYSNWAEKKQI